MKDKLITVATHSFEKAQFIKMELGKEGIECVLSNINLIQGAFSGGVKVRVLEENREKSLAIIEKINEKLFSQESKIPTKREVLVPVDFSDYSLRACVFGAEIAHDMGAMLVLMHTYFSPVINTMPYTEAFAFDINMDKSLQEIEEKAQTDMKHLVKHLKSEMSAKTGHSVKITTVVNEGIPEEEILSYSRKNNPLVIVMGTRGKNRKKDDLVGSVTAEVIDRAKVPVLAIPEDTPHKSAQDIKNLVYITQFDNNDFVAIAKLIKMVGNKDVVIHCIHMGQNSDDPWNEVKLKGMQDYLLKSHPGKSILCDFVEGDDLVLSIEKIVRDRKIDVIALTARKRNIIARMLNPGIARRMLFHTDTPLLVFHA